MSDYDQSLEDELLGDEPDYETEPEAPETREHADRMLRRLARLEREIAEAEEIALAEIEAIQEWLAKRRGAVAPQKEWLLLALQAFHEAVLRRDTRALSVDLPSGRLTSRRGQPEWDFEDVEAFLAWAREHAPGLIRQKPTPPPEIDVPKAKIYLTIRDEKDRALEHGVAPGGERPPGLVVVPPERSFGVDLRSAVRREEGDSDAEEG